MQYRPVRNSVTRNRRIPAVVALGATACAAAVISASPAVAAATSHSVFAARAYGSYARLGTTISSGASADVPLCTTTSGASVSDKTAATTVPGVGAVGAVTTNVRSASSGATVESLGSSSTAGMSLLGGLITASTVTTQATISYSTAKSYVRTGAVNLVGLKIAGQSIAAHPTLDQTISLPDIGTVVLNHQAGTYSLGAHSQAVTALQVTLTAGNKLHLPTGTVIVGHSSATLHYPIRSLPWGAASATTVAVGSSVKSGPTTPVTVPCGGTDGTTITYNSVGVSMPGVLTTGATTSSAHSDESSYQTLTSDRDTIANVNLFDGVVTASAVTTQANAYRVASNRKYTGTTTGTKIAGLKINGQAYTAAVKENTSMKIVGVGTLYLRRTTHYATGLKEYGLQFQLSVARNGLKAGTIISIGYASAGVYNN
jgi:hypothetical protein